MSTCFYSARISSGPLPSDTVISPNGQDSRHPVSIHHASNLDSLVLMSSCVEHPPRGTAVDQICEKAVDKVPNLASLMKPLVNDRKQQYRLRVQNSERSVNISRV